jgi:hypothetical protein
MVILTFKGGFIGFVSLFCIFLVLMPELHCVQGCSRAFSGSAYLSQHKKSCRFVQKLREKARDVRREQGLGPTVSKDVAPLIDRKQCLQVNFSPFSIDLMTD